MYENKIIYGPVDSRRLGRWENEKLLECGKSLGINLSKIKVCSFDCIYCSCGETRKVIYKAGKDDYFSLQEIESAVRKGFNYHKQKGTLIDYISLVGWTEPTLHPEIDEVIDLILEIKQEYFPDIPTAIFTNSTTLDRENVRKALKKIDRTFFKLDASDSSVFEKVNRHHPNIKLERIIDGLAEFSKETNKVELSAMVLKTNYKDLASERYAKVIKKINPSNNLIYLCTPDWLRPTTSGGISLIPKQEIIEYVKKSIDGFGYKAIILPPKRQGFHPLVRK